MPNDDAAAAADAKPVLAVDMDEVLCGTCQAMVDFHNGHYATRLRVSDFSSYCYEDVWGGTREEAIAKVREFYASDHFSERMQRIPGALEALTMLKNKYDLVIVTARQEFVKPDTHKFVDDNYPGIFKEIHFANHFLTAEEEKRMVSKSKSDLLHEVGSDILIDDSLHHAFECASKGKRVFLFDHEGCYPWNKLPEDTSLPDNVTRVHEWKDIVTALM
ncbi:HAD-like domain-containing protein [Chytriomyces sp. MP71]|nr:HAD-like domain-containing protein [Chytriomyces sp. MP71]